MDFKKNQEVILKIDDLGNNGEGIGHVDGYALLSRKYCRVRPYARGL